MAQTKKIILKWLLPSVKLAYKLLAVSAEVFCRHSFGWRYGFQLVGGFLLCFLYTILIRAAAPSMTSHLLDIYLWIFFLLSLVHLIGLCRQRPPIPHSYSTGQSWQFWQRIGFGQNAVHLVFEPGLHVLAGVIIYSVDSPLSVWLQTAGVCLFIKEIISLWQHHEHLLDALDSRIEGQRISQAVRQHSAPQSGGEQPVNPVTPAQPSRQPISPLAQIVRNLDPALRRIISSEEGDFPVEPNVSVPGNFSDGPQPPQ